VPAFVLVHGGWRGRGRRPLSYRKC
jgi:hypothetical protein